MKENLFFDIARNKEYFDNYFNSSADYFYKPIKVFNKNASIVMCEAMVDRQRLWQIFLAPINELDGDKNADEIFDFILNETTIPANSSLVYDFETAVFFLTAGFSLLLIDGASKALVLPAQGIPLRGVSESTTEGNLKGSKESFTDSSRLNMALIRRRVRGENFSIEAMQIGQKSKTEVCLCYNSDYCPKELVEKTKEKLNKINLPMIFDSGYIAPFIDDTKYSAFQAVGYTERPDVFCAKLCEGKIGLIVDGTPYAIIYPYFFHENFTTCDDYSQRPYFASFMRLLRYFSFIISIILPSLYVSFTLHAPQVLPKELIYFIYSDKNSSVLPLFLEAILITIILEIIKEAGLRLPKPIGHAVTFVAALIIGDAAVQAGLIGAAVLIVCAMSVISSFVIPSFYESIIIIRIVLLLLSGFFGVVGFGFGIVLVLMNMISVNAAGYDYLFLIDNSKLFLKDGIFKNSWRNKKDNFSLKGDDYAQN